MPRLPYRMFLWVFSVSNAIVWFVILCGLGWFLHSHFADAGGLARPAGARLVCLGLILPTVLALQGAIVNLRVQFVGGRFSPPTDGVTPRGPLRNPWRVALTVAAMFWMAGLPVLFGGLHVLLPPALGARGAATLMGGIGALVILLLVVTVADREFRRYLCAIDAPPAAPLPATTYVLWRIAVPWGVVNLSINAVLAWITYGGEGTVAVGDLRVDLVVMAFLISVFMALSALPEVEMDVRRGVVHLPLWLPSMPRLWVRYAYALGVASLMYVAVSSAMAASGRPAVSLAATILIKGLSSAVVAAGASGTCALWALDRCASQRAASVRLDAMSRSRSSRRIGEVR